MAFQLKITKGSGAGKVFPFADEEARIGRTPENDIIVKDGGVSRNHARVYVKGGRYFVEDLKSSNGTKLNGTTIGGPKELKAGDTVTIGEVTFAFTLSEEEEAEPPPDVTASEDDEPGDEQALRRKTIPQGRGTVKREPAAEDEAPEGGEESPPDAPPARRKPESRRRPASALAVRSSRDAVRPVDPDARDETLPEKSSRAPGGVARAAPESAAERARRRREASQSLSGRIVYGFGQLPLFGKILVVLVGVGVLGGGTAGAIHGLKGQGPVSRGPEPSKLGIGRVADSFGYGEGVHWSRPDMKIFSFDLNTATKAVAVLRYQASNVSQDEVVITLNGVEQGSIPADTLDTEARELELVLRPANLKQHDSNSVLFDNTKNPPGKEAWKVWNIGLEIVPIPEVSAEELLRLAEKDSQKAKEFYDLRDVGPDNLFKAWKSYRNAWLTLEGLPGEKPELYDLVRAQMRIIAPELDRRCRLMMLEAQRFIALKKGKKARQVLDDVARYFPTKEHRCQALAHEKMDEYEL